MGKKAQKYFFLFFCFLPLKFSKQIKEGGGRKKYLTSYLLDFNKYSKNLKLNIKLLF